MTNLLTLAAILPMLANPVQVDTEQHIMPTVDIPQSQLITTQPTTPRANAKISSRAGGVLPEQSINGTDPYKNAPDGMEQTEFYRSGECYYLFFGQVTYAPVDGQIATLAIGENEIWIKSPFAEGGLSTWIKGELDPQGNVTVRTPQCVATMTENNTGKTVPMYLVNVRDEEVEESDGTKYHTFVENTENSVIRYKWDGTSLTLVEGLLGECFWMPDIDPGEGDGWMWYGVVDLKQKFEPCPHTQPMPPAGVDFKDYVMTYTSSTSDARLGQKIKVGFDGDDCWIKELHPILTGFYVKGTKTAEGYTFPNQYLGKVQEVGYHAFFRPGYYVADEYGNKSIGVKDEITLSFDAATVTFTSADDALWMIGAGNGKISYLQRNDNPSLVPPSENSTPSLQDPFGLQYSEPWPEYGVPGMLIFNLPQFDRNGNWVDTERLSFSIFVDDEPFEFSEPVYDGIPAGTYDIPYLVPIAWMADIIRSDENFTVNINTDNYYKLGVRLNYSYNGIIGHSGIVSIQTAAINEIGSEPRAIDHVEYYNLAGVRISSPTDGIYIKRTVYTDGTNSAEKTAITRK